jgi:hypothetical protein
MVEPQPSKLIMPVRSRSAALKEAQLRGLFGSDLEAFRLFENLVVQQTCNSVQHGASRPQLQTLMSMEKLVPI